MKYFVLSCFLSIFYFNSWSQGGMANMTGARLNALAGNGETFRDANALLSNQAGIAFIENQTLMVALERQFWLESLTQASLGFAQPVKNGAFGAQIKYYGNQYYREGKAGIGYGRKLSENFSLGAQINYIFIQVEEGGSEGVFSIEGGAQGSILPGINLGFHVFSPVAVTFSNGYRVPTIFRIGANIELSNHVVFFTGLEKNIAFKESYRFGLEYELVKQFLIRCGLQTNPQLITFGFGLPVMKNFSLDFSSTWNQILGLSSFFSANYTF